MRATEREVREAEGEVRMLPGWGGWGPTPTLDP